MDDIYNPLKEVKALGDGITKGLDALKARTAPPPTTPRLIEHPDGSVTTREGAVLRGARPQPGGAPSGTK